MISPYPASPAGVAHSAAGGDTVVLLSGRAVGEAFALAGGGVLGRPQGAFVFDGGRTASAGLGLVGEEGTR
jgi:hypothetical protein